MISDGLTQAAKGFMGGSGGCFDGGQCADPAERVRSRQEPGKYPVLGTQKSFAPSARTVPLLFGSAKADSLGWEGDSL